MAQDESEDIHDAEIGVEAIPRASDTTAPG